MLWSLTFALDRPTIQSQVVPICLFDQGACNYLLLSSLSAYKPPVKPSLIEKPSTKRRDIFPMLRYIAVAFDSLVLFQFVKLRLSLLFPFRASNFAHLTEFLRGSWDIHSEFPKLHFAGYDFLVCCSVRLGPSMVFEKIQEQLMGLVPKWK